MEGRDLIGCVGSEKIQRINESGSPAVALIDCGTKATIIRELTERGCAVVLVPSTAEIDAVIQQKPDAVLVSNGPGDPAVLLPLIEKVKTLIGKLPLFGICLGHQLISLALGARSFKMKFGHHGINHPVRDEFTKRVFVTSQNHGFCISDKDLPEGTAVWFRNANDQTVEGICHPGLNIWTAQFHPEAAPGPRDSGWIFQRFIEQTAARVRTAVS
jgi:carbamoyl-phosphate synthase small subunit